MDAVQEGYDIACCFLCMLACPPTLLLCESERGDLRGVAESGGSGERWWMMSGLMTAQAAPCPLPEDPSACQLPNCWCSKSGTMIPGGLTPSETPQMIVLTVDDAVVSRVMPFYRRLFDGRFANPDGCPIRATFFVSHEWNNYDQTQWLFSKGHEIAVNSIT